MTLRLISLEAIPIKTQSLFFICSRKSLQIEKEGQLPNTSVRVQIVFFGTLKFQSTEVSWCH